MVSKRAMTNRVSLGAITALVWAWTLCGFTSAHAAAQDEMPSTSVSDCARCGCASFFPPEVGSDESSVYCDLGERPLWQREAADGYARRLRVFIFPAYRHSRIAIRIDTKTTGDSVGNFSLTLPSGNEQEPEVNEQVAFPVSANDLTILDQLIDKADLWTIHPEHWVPADWLTDNPRTVCTDGAQIVMERLAGSHYRYSEGNIPCGLPSRVLKFVDHVIDMTGLGKTRVHFWIRN